MKFSNFNLKTSLTKATDFIVGFTANTTNNIKISAQNLYDDIKTYVVDGLASTQLLVKSIKFDTLSAPVSPATSELYWDTVNECLAYKTPYDSITEVGETVNIRGINKTGAPILNGTICYVSGAVGKIPKMFPARADSLTTCSGILVVATHEIADNNKGLFTVIGIVRSLNTNSYTVGDVLYLSAANTGEFTNVKPSYPNYVIEIGQVNEKSVNDGEILVHVKSVDLIASETQRGISILANQTKAEDAATNATVGNIDHDSNVTPRGLRWFNDKIKTLAQTITNIWTFDGVAFGIGEVVKYLGQNTPTNAVANEKWDIEIPLVNIFGSIEVVINGSFNTGNAYGILRKTISTIALSSGTITSQISGYTLVQGGINGFYAISDLIYDSVKAKFVIKIAKINANTSSPVRVVVRHIRGGNSALTNSVFNTVVLSATYTTDTTVYPTPVFNMNETLDILRGKAVNFRQTQNTETNGDFRYNSSSTDTSEEYRTGGVWTAFRKMLATGINQFGAILAGNYSEFEANGFLKFNGTAEAWDDIDLPLIVKTTGTGTPTLTTMNGSTLQAYTWAINDSLPCEPTEQGHEYKQNSANSELHAHVYTNVVDGTDRYIKLEAEIGWTNFNSAQTVTTYTSADLLIPANTPINTHLIFNIATNLTTKNIGSHIIGRLKRVAATGGLTAPSVNPFITKLQIHAKKDTAGSRTATAK